jgi:FAD/FMN-containing dehydrogenase
VLEGLSRLEPPLRSPGRRRGRFVNYDKTVRVPRVEWLVPATEEELAQRLAAAAASGRKVRVVGAGHSWSPIAAPDDLAVSLDRMTGVVGWGPDWVRVRGGTRLRHLYRELAGRGRALPIVASIAQQSLAGAVATGTHGSSLAHGNLSSLVTAARLISADGSQHDFGPEDEELDGVRVHLGALGAVTELTLRTTDAFRLAQTIEPVAVERVPAMVEQVGRSAEFVKVWWMPHTRHALVFRYERTDEPTTRWPSPTAERLLENWAPRIVLHPIWGWQRRRPASVPALNRIAARWLVKGRRVGPSPLLLTTPEPIRHHETEAAVGLEVAGEAFDRVVALIRRRRLRVNFILELRFVRADTAWMSSAHGRDVVHLSACTAVTAERQAYFEGFWAEMRQLGGRPHWAKAMDHDRSELAALYPMAGRFAALRDRLDPERVFTNGFLERTLGA